MSTESGPKPVKVYAVVDTRTGEVMHACAERDDAERFGGGIPLWAIVECVGGTSVPVSRAEARAITLAETAKLEERLAEDRKSDLLGNLSSVPASREDVAREVYEILNPEPFATFEGESAFKRARYLRVAGLLATRSAPDARLRKMEDALRHIAQSCDTLSPQEFINACANGLGVDRHEYAGECPPHTSLMEYHKGTARPAAPAPADAPETGDVREVRHVAARAVRLLGMIVDQQKIPERQFRERYNIDKDGEKIAYEESHEIAQRIIDMLTAALALSAPAAPVASPEPAPATPLPCPWCGSEVEVEGVPRVIADRVACPGCLATGPNRHGEAEAIAAWNRVAGRAAFSGATDAGLLALLEEARGDLVELEEAASYKPGRFTGDLIPRIRAALSRAGERS